MEAMDPATGEVKTIEEAAKDIPPPKYWRRTEGIIEGDVGPEYEEAFWTVQSIVGPILKAAAENPYNKSRYTDLPSLLAQTMPHITKAGLTLKQGAGRIISYGSSDNLRRMQILPIWTQVRHKTTGQWERVYFEMPLLKMDPQGFGSAFTYGRRYALQGFWCVAGTDDDAVLASLRPNLDAQAVESPAAGIIQQMDECRTAEELVAWQERNKPGFEILEETVIAELRKAYSQKMKDLKAAAPEISAQKIKRTSKG
jgi:hypothetical protein